MIRRLLIFALILLWTPTWAAVANLGTPASEQGNSTTASVAVTVSSGTNVVAYIVVFANSETAISSMNTFGGVAPVLVGDYAGSIHVYRVINPAAGATNATANLAAGVFWSIHVIVLQGADQTTPDDGLDGGNTSTEVISVSTTAITSAVGDLVLGFGLMTYPDIAAADGATLSTEEEAIDSSVVSTALVYEAGAASVVVGTSSSTASFADNIIFGWNVNAAAGGGGSSALPKILQQLEH